MFSNKYTCPRDNRRTWGIGNIPENVEDAVTVFYVVIQKDASH